MGWLWKGKRWHRVIQRGAAVFHICGPKTKERLHYCYFNINSKKQKQKKSPIIQIIQPIFWLSFAVLYCCCWCIVFDSWVFVSFWDLYILSVSCSLYPVCAILPSLFVFPVRVRHLASLLLLCVCVLVGLVPGSWLPDSSQSHYSREWLRFSLCRNVKRVTVTRTPALVLILLIHLLVWKTYLYFLCVYSSGEILSMTIAI